MEARLSDFLAALNSRPRAVLAHTPTPLEPLKNLRASLGIEIHVKRDDCTGLAMGGNKARQLEFYLGEAQQQGADTILITGAVQSNYVRMAAAAARKCGMQIHIQLEQRVPGMDSLYYRSGNVLLDHLLGATLHEYPLGEDEAGADANLEKIAAGVRGDGATPYVIHLGADHPPLGALGYVRAAAELLNQLQDDRVAIEHIVVPSGSSHTHSGLLFGLRALDCHIPVTGICVRRDAAQQHARVVSCTAAIAQLLDLPNPVSAHDVQVFDGVLAPGYGLFGDAVREAMRLAAEGEGILLDPVYTGKAFAGLLALLRNGSFTKGAVLFLHTGGTPALFGYQSALLGDRG
jgi:D-cysteine desulfhydrase family pyridoxal phosphate-dependent enzyme